MSRGRIWVALLAGGLLSLAGALRAWAPDAAAQNLRPPIGRPTIQARRAPIDLYQRTCRADPATVECEALLGIIRARVIEALEEIEAAQDQRGVPAALDALSMGEDEPAIRLVAARALRGFADARGVKEAAAPLLWDPHVALQEAGAAVLEASGHATYARLGQQWMTGHESLRRPLSILDVSVPRPVASLGFTAYAGAVPYPPGDSDRSAAWSTPDAVETVAAFYARTHSVRAVTAAEWDRQRDRAAGAAAALDPRDVAEMERLAEQMGRRPSPELARRLQEIGERMQRQAEAQSAQMVGGISSVATPPGDTRESPRRTARIFVLENRGGRPVRAVVVYREDVLRRTIVQMLWEPAGPTR